jgi:hypothetical protein
MPYRIKRARDGAIDGDYATQEIAENAANGWQKLFKDDDFVVFEVLKQDRKGRAFWMMMKHRGLVMQTGESVK